MLPVYLHQCARILTGLCDFCDIEGTLVPGMGQYLYVMTLLLCVIQGVKDHVRIPDQKALAPDAQPVGDHSASQDCKVEACQHYVQILPVII